MNASLVGKIGDHSLGIFLMNTLHSEKVGVKGLIEKTAGTKSMHDILLLLMKNYESGVFSAC